MNAIVKMEYTQTGVSHTVAVRGMERKTAEAVDLSRELLHKCKNVTVLLLKEFAFARKRELVLTECYICYCLAGSLQLELGAYCEFLETAPVSKQAFPKAQANFNPAFVQKFADGLAGLHEQDSNILV